MLENVHVRRLHCRQVAYDDDWKKEVEDRVSHILEGTRKHSSEDSPEKYNHAITQEEVQQAINKMKPKSAPGPDQILPIMVTSAETVLAAPLQHLCNICWKSGEVPKSWKKDNRIYFPKPGKTDRKSLPRYKSD